MVRKTVALVPGSFRPPHNGHWEMIKHYSKIADKVIVVISEPSEKNLRYTKSGKIISSDVSKQIFNLFKTRDKTKNVEVMVSTSPSPITCVYDYVQSKLCDVNVIVGSSKKDNDWRRWDRISKYMKKYNPSVTILDPFKNAFDPAVVNDQNISATVIRENIDNLKLCKKFLPQTLTDNDIDKIISLLS